MMDLAVGIDYSLFILSRYREERDRGLEKQQAIEASAGSAGRAVVFSGMTVVLALLGMLIIPENTFKAFGIGAIIVVFVAVITGITLLPAIIGILGDRVSAVRAPLPLTLGLFIAGVTGGLGSILGHELGHRDVGVADRGLVEKHELRVEATQLAIDNLVEHVRRFTRPLQLGSVDALFLLDRLG